MSSTVSTAPPNRSASAAPARDPFAEMFRKGGVSRKAIEAIDSSGNNLVTASDWLAVLDEDFVTLSCTLTANSTDSLVTTIGLVLIDGNGNDLGSFYFYTGDDGLSTGSAFPSLTVPAGGLTVGSTATGFVIGMVGGEFYNPSSSVTVSSL